MRKKILVILMVMSMLMISACSGGESSSADNDKSDGKEVEEAENDSYGKTVTVALWWSETEIAAADEVLKDFTEKTGINVELKYVPYANFQQQMISEITAGKSADLILCSYEMIASYYKNGLMYDLTDLMKRDDVHFEQFFNAEQWTCNDHMYGLPSENPVFYFFANKDLIEAAGYEVPYGNWTFDELREIAIACTDTENGVYGLTDTRTSTNPAEWYALNGGTTFSKDGSECTINTENVVNACEFLRKLIYEDKAAPEPSVYSTTSGDQMFLDGKAAFCFNGTWGTAYMRANADKVDFNWDVIYAPTGPDAEGNPTLGWTCGLFIPSNCDDVEAAWEVMKYWGSTEGLNSISIQGLSTLPCSQECIDAEVYYIEGEDPQNFNKEFITGLMERVVYPVESKMALTDTATNAIASLSEIFASNKDSREVCDAAYETIISQWNDIYFME